ncbi:MAG: hypothetical protein AMXMBFR84_34080 [Candidatus Hydrogenedentota bacterium]
MAVTSPTEPPQIAWKNRRKEDPEARMTFIEHLGELRARIVRIGIAILVGTVIAYVFYDWIFYVVTQPLMPVQAHREKLEEQYGAPAPGVAGNWTIVAPIGNFTARQATPEDLAKAGVTAITPGTAPSPDTADQTATPAESTPPNSEAIPAAPNPYYVWEFPKDGFQGLLVRPVETEEEEGMKWVMQNPLEGFMTQFKLAVLFGIVFASPYIVYQICAFIFPGLTSGERSVAMFLLMGSSSLSLAGVTVVYFFIFPNILPFLLAWTPPGVFLQLRVNETIPFILKSILGFAVAFQFPMVVLLLVYLDLLTTEVLKKQRRVAIVIIFIAAAILTPGADPGSMLMMALPLMLLYEVSIWLSYFVIKRRDRKKQNA